MMTDAIQHFLLVFDGATATLLGTFGSDTDAAVAASADTEQQYEADPRIEIVLIGSDSIETVRITHATPTISLRRSGDSATAARDGR